MGRPLVTAPPSLARHGAFALRCRARRSWRFAAASKPEKGGSSMKTYLHLLTIFVPILCVSCAGNSRATRGETTSSGEITILQKPTPVSRQEKVANGKCTAVISYNKDGEIDNVSSPDCYVGSNVLYITSDQRTFYKL